MIVAPYAAVAGIFLVYLSVRVIRLRRSLHVSVGTGGDAGLERAQRVHANFTEYTPLLLLMLGLAELQGLPGWAVHAFGIGILAGRLCHFLGFRSAEAPGKLRVAGMVLTFAALSLLAVVLLAGAVLGGG